MRHEFEDYNHSKTLFVAPAAEAGFVTVGITTYGLEDVYDLPVDDAPAVALAILEAAGNSRSHAIGMEKTAENAVLRAVDNLDRAVTLQHRERAAEAEREAEDAKVDAYRRMIYGTIETGDGWYPWDVLGSAEQSTWRARYQAARMHFEEQS